ncbi:hypothetical protein ABPG77_004985 [Micractinium sp. CCAP 211/92]
MAKLWALAVVVAALAAVAAVQAAEQKVTWGLGQNYGTPIKATSGDMVTLDWTGQGLHGVWNVPAAKCATASDPHTVVVDPKDGGTWSFTCNSSTKGDNFYMCPVDGHCQAGMLLTISCAP